ncbi:OmpA family protein [Algoriphagus sp. YJ13C]|uniref:OmpA family protein n=2 Tax=Algoriphagus pacificus TaxID=2811234 RepID=A0ABS3CBF1_9BACT|nr:OmpA family protein [Algoriphagus pacificus]
MVLIMKKTLTLLIITSGLLFGSLGTTEAQKSKVRYADSLMAVDHNYKTAVAVYQEAYAKKPNYETAKKTAEAYDVLRDYDNAYDWWKTTVGYEESTPEDFAQLLRYAQLTDNLSEAQSLLESKGVGPDSIQVAELLKMQSPRKLKVAGVEGLNSSESDFDLTVDGNGNKYFVSDRGGSFVDEMPGIRIDGRNRIFSEEKQDYTGREYFTVYRQDKDGNVSEVVSNVPNTYNFSDPSYAKEAGVLFYSVTRGITKVKKNRNITVQPEIYYSKVNAEGGLEGFTPVPFNDSIGYAVMNPFVDEEAKRLYFTSDMPGGMGGYDLYYSEYDDNMSFGTPVNLGASVNTPGDESHAFRKEDKFYFSSKGGSHPTMGGMDIYQADYSATGISNVKNMGAPVNSLADDFAYREVDKEDGKTEVYLSSNRKGGMGLDDIYSVEEVYKQFLARVIDCEGVVISDSYLATLRDKTQNGNVQTQRNGKGELTAELEPDSDFGIKISKPGYFSITDEDITTKGFTGDTLKREYKLVPIPYQLPVYVDIVYYDLDKYMIREDAKPVLDKLGELMNRYKFLDLLVGSHTDSRASDEYNITLSNNRAKAVTEYMAQYNIPAERIRLEWFGEQNLINDCGNGVPCPESEHQLNRRSELVLEAFSDPSKQYEIPEELKDKDFCDPEDLFTQIQDEIAQIPTIYFDFDKSMLRSVHKKELERTAIMLKRMPNLMLYIEGHTDQRGDDEYNKELSERRADAVKAYLTKRGIEDNRMEETWFGETKPVHDCNEVTCTPAMHQLNRRTELRVGKSQFTYSGRQKKVDVL